MPTIAKQEFDKADLLGKEGWWAEVVQTNWMDEEVILKVFIRDVPKHGSISGIVADGFLDDYVSVTKKGDMIWFAPFEVVKIWK